MKNVFREKHAVRNRLKVHRAVNGLKCKCGGAISSFNDFAVQANRYSGAFVRCCGKCGKWFVDNE